jgi:isocitrate/isopropylmalate dehydrogenase
MRKYKIGWLPGVGIGVEVLEAAKIVLDKLELSHEIFDRLHKGSTRFSTKCATK